MKIAYLFGSLNRGGTETLMLDVCRNLKKKDFDAIGVYRKGGVLENDFIASNVPFHNLVVGKNPLNYLWKLRKLLIKNKVEIIHAHQPIDAFFAKMALIGTKIKILLTLHGFDNINNQKKDKLLNIILSKTDKNIFVSHYQKEYYIEKYKLEQTKQFVLYNGISFEKITNRKNQSNLRKELGLKSDVFLMAMVGNFNEVRDHFTVCKFLKLLIDTGVNFHFLFIGKKNNHLPSKFEECINFCETNQMLDNVIFTGARNDVPQILSQLDAFVYSTEQDTFGIAVVEALAVGIPVFVNDWAVMKEITDSGKDAIIYKTKDEGDLLDKFMLFLSDKEKYNVIAQKNILKIKDKFSIQNHINNLKFIYLTSYENK